MTSTSITTIGGVVVVTQVIPQDETSIPLQTAATTTTTTQAPPPVTQAPPPRSAPLTKKDDMTAAFLQGEPQGLGLVQIFIGLVCVLFSLTAVYSKILIVHAPFCVAIAFVVSGSLAVAARRATSVRLVWAALVWNLFSAVLSLGGVAYLCWLLSDGPPSQQFCRDKTLVETRSTLDEWTTCTHKMWRLDVVLFGLRGLLLVLLVLQVCVVVTVCVFSSKAIGRYARDARDARDAPIVVVVDDGSTLGSSTASELGSDVALLGSEGEETSKLPPN